MRDSTREATLGSAGALLGGALLICLLFGLFDMFGTGDGAETGRRAAVLSSAALAVVGAGLLTHGLMMRLRSGLDAGAVALALVPVAVLGALWLYARGAGEDGANRIDDPGLPYMFEYPGSWHRDPPTDLPLLPSIGNLTSVSSDKDAATVVNGVLVGTFAYRNEEVFDQQMRQLLGVRGTLLSRSVERVAGLPAVRYTYDDSSAYDGSVTTVFAEGRGYWIQCLYKADKQVTDEACAQILASFQTRDRAPAARAAGRDVF